MRRRDFLSLIGERFRFKEGNMNDLPPTARVMQVLMGVMNSAAVSAIARLGIPDHLHSGPKTVEELAHAVGAKPELLFRLMRATAGLGILTQTPDGRWEQTPMSDVLRSDATKTLRHFACLISDDWHVRALGSLDETVRTGEQATNRIIRNAGVRVLREGSEVRREFQSSYDFVLHGRGADDSQSV